jgi:hypothetical protein
MKKNIYERTPGMVQNLSRPAAKIGRNIYILCDILESYVYVLY